MEEALGKIEGKVLPVVAGDTYLPLQLALGVGELGLGEAVVAHAV